MPAAAISRAQLDQQLAAGDRRSGGFLYRPVCPRCSACQSLRLDVADFAPSRSQHRVLKRGDPLIRVETGPPQVDSARVQLFNQHRRQRGLSNGELDIDAAEYHEFLVDTCCETFELRQYRGDRLISVAICDRGDQAISAVYCYFDPNEGRLSPGTYSILKQVELCRQWKLRYLYLGYYVQDSPHMAYKSRFLPHERLIDGRWRRFCQQ